MPYHKTPHRILSFLIALVWLINGLFCKVLHLVPRHEQIVARILGSAHAGFYTTAIGIAEIGMAFWMLIGKWRRRSAILQIIVIATMNIIEAVLAPDLLLFGRLNAVFALLFIALIYYNDFVLGKSRPASNLSWARS